LTAAGPGAGRGRTAPVPASDLMIQAEHLRKSYGPTSVLDDLSLELGAGEGLTLLGPNGAGKTTLLRILAGQTELHGGELVFQKAARVALHDQRPPLERELTLREYVLAGAADLVAAEEELRRLEQAMADGVHDRATLNAYGATQARLEHAGGYAWREHANSVVRGLGFADDDLDRPLRTFSGGELTRASLARALGGAPDLLLLDEPTNHLDVESLEWLEKEIETIDAGVILVAHDRWFLESVTTAVLELAGGRSIYFPGTWHTWRLEKAARALDASRNVDRVQADIERLNRFVERFRYKKSKAKQAQAKLTQIGRLQKEKAGAAGELERLSVKRRTLGFEFLKPPRSGRTVVEANGVELRVPDRVLLSDAAFALERGEHVALVGPNGSGKTTMLETLLGRRDAAAGTIRLGHGVEAAYFSQHEVELDTRGSVLQCAQGATGLSRPEAQALLGRFLFSGWGEHEKQVSVLSGGERRRLALALTVASGANFLILDEPTNHLDLESREALEAALEAFPGTILLVSHDRALLDAIAERTLAVEDGELRSYDGGWADYVRKRDEREAPPQPPEPKPRRGQPKPRPPREAPSELARVEAQIAAREREVAELEARLADDWGNVEVLAAHRRARDDLQTLLGRWEELFEQAQA
jgi:ATP-binding cassette, subfamily F, member 3